MNKIAIIYKSKYGSTKQYAQMLQAELTGSDIYNLDEFKIDMADDYDILIFGSATYMGNILAVPFLNRNWDSLRDKKVYLFNVGIRPKDSKESLASYAKLDEPLRGGLLGYAKLQGRLDMSKLNIFEKIIVSMLKETPGDNVSKENLRPILASLAPYI